jgi:hypothetical protein
MARYLAAGDVLINPDLLAYAVVETDSDGLQLRLGLLAPGGGSPSEVRLGGLEARSVLKWLRAHTEFLDAGGSPRRRGPAPVVGHDLRVAAGSRP